MKRLVVTISLSLVVVLALSFVYVSRVASAKPIPPSVQMLSASYPNTTLPATVTTTVETLSFTVAAPAKLEVTSENETFGVSGTATCEIALDGTIFAPGIEQSSFSPDATGTDTSVSAGSHTLTVQCTAGLAGAFAQGSVSAIITTGL